MTAQRKFLTPNKRIFRTFVSQNLSNNFWNTEHADNLETTQKLILKKVYEKQFIKTYLYNSVDALVLSDNSKLTRSASAAIR